VCDGKVGAFACAKAVKALHPVGSFGEIICSFLVGKLLRASFSFVVITPRPNLHLFLYLNIETSQLPSNFLESIFIYSNEVNKLEKVVI
jgi:hypothetical protein